ncbi:hypothetical protein VOLCADRAFT_117596 [Volvox carteri f. nagariensis]|uniref:Nucleotide-diphospho-sugar transferase domain-containing protein n=1 Tax=Volvox carteri f. nagariensis TaxID=3068 RepID=D8TVS0_VOLCA|nr:uncharacterized protein VOLCADRAFT_117596 [Volvox carteri f. nagariensis]EFJ48351.1 hypothetical protein VOLCADRAFT_117596 [Volvox carteri f. nagariensis]|eukprot:XP_002950605.1 hypothetical protein VOLCADRAFT_117596 [Volvox carteri f. nagariensis]
MLEARSFKGEIILTHENRADSAAQWIWRLLRMGYAHTVVLTRGEHSCMQLTVSYTAASTAQAGSSSSSSSSSSLLQPQLLAPQQVALFLEEPPYWRLQLAAMIVRLGGYNLLGLDTDVVLQDDFYWWMQQPDYRDYQLFVQRDGADLTSREGAGLQGVLRNIRWREQPRLPAALNCTFTTCWEQAVVTDAIYSALAGRPVFWRCLERRPLDATWESRDDGRKRFLDANTQLVGPQLARRNFSMSRPGPACHLPLLGSGSGSGSDAGSSGGLLWGLEGVLRQPHFGGQWPEALGGRALGESRGPVASAFLQMMREAGPPLWPDPEDPSTQAAATSVVPERFSQLSNHLVCDWAQCGSKGMFLRTTFLRNPDPDTSTAWEGKGEEEEENDPCVVLGHVGMAPGKRLQLMVNGHYNMDLAAAVHGPGGPYFATNGHLQGLAHHSSLMRAGLLGHHASRRGGHALCQLCQLLPPSPQFPSTSQFKLCAKSMYGNILKISQIAPPRVVALLPGALSPGPHNPTTAAAAAAAAGEFLDSSSGGGGAATSPLVLRSCLHGPVHSERRGHMHTNPYPTARMLLSYEVVDLPEALRAAHHHWLSHCCGLSWPDSRNHICFGDF